MDILSIMRNRKSARAFKAKPVTRAEIEEIINSAGLAPSAINVQPWEYVVVYGEEKDRLARRLLKIHSERKVTCGPGTAAPLPDRFVQRSRLASKEMANTERLDHRIEGHALCGLGDEPAPKDQVLIYGEMRK